MYWTESTRERLMREVEAFCELHEMSKTEFGKRATGGGSFWSRLAGHDKDATGVSLRTIERAELFMRDYVPDRYFECVNCNEQFPAGPFSQ